MEILCHGNGFANPHGFSPGMRDVGCGCDADSERSRISCPLWKRELLIETSLRRVLSINGNIRNCYDFFLQNSIYSVSKNFTILSKINSSVFFSRTLLLKYTINILSLCWGKKLQACDQAQEIVMEVKETEWTKKWPLFVVCSTEQEFAHCTVHNQLIKLLIISNN